jgi:hypothetical protein
MAAIAKRGRPSTYTPEIATEICNLLAAGETVNKICQRKGMPAQTTVYEWSEGLNGAPLSFVENFARARKRQAETWASQTIAIADTCRIGEKVERKQIGWECPVCKRPAKWSSSQWTHGDGKPICGSVKKPDRVFEEKVITGDMIERAKLQVDTRKWLISKLKPETYGDRLELAGDARAPLTLVVERIGAAVRPAIDITPERAQLDRSKEQK